MRSPGPLSTVTGPNTFIGMSTSLYTRLDSLRLLNLSVLFNWSTNICYFTFLNSLSFHSFSYRSGNERNYEEGLEGRVIGIQSDSFLQLLPFLTRLDSSPVPSSHHRRSLQPHYTSSGGRPSLTLDQCDSPCLLDLLV